MQAGNPKKYFLDRRYFFSIILSLFLKNPVALHGTIQHVVDSVPKNLNGFDTVISIGAGVYAEHVDLSGFCAATKSLTIRGAGSGNTSVLSLDIRNCALYVNVRGLAITHCKNPWFTAAKYGLIVSTCGFVSVQDCVFTTPQDISDACISVSYGARVLLINSTLSGRSGANVGTMSMLYAQSVAIDTTAYRFNVCGGFAWSVMNTGNTTDYIVGGGQVFQ